MTKKVCGGKCGGGSSTSFRRRHAVAHGAVCAEVKQGRVPGAVPPTLAIAGRLVVERRQTA